MIDVIEAHDEFPTVQLVKKGPFAAFYEWSSNTINIYACENLSEESATNIILHEIEHWAQFKYVTLDEILPTREAYIKASLPEYSSFLELPFVERINPYKLEGNEFAIISFNMRKREKKKIQNRIKRWLHNVI